MSLPRLNVVEVVSVSLGESVLAVKLDVGLGEEVNGAIKVETIVEGLVNIDEVFGNVGEEREVGGKTHGADREGDKVKGEGFPGGVNEVNVWPGVGEEVPG